MACRLLITTMAPDRQSGPPVKLTIPQDYRTKDDALDGAARQLRLEKAGSRKGARRGSVLLELRIECDENVSRKLAEFENNYGLSRSGDARKPQTMRSSSSHAYPKHYCREKLADQ
jgi:hypothetical protein